MSTPIETDLASRTVPAGQAVYHQSPIFDQETVPENLRTRHSTKEGAWARVCLLEGAVTYVEERPDGEITRRLSTPDTQVIEPQVWHRLELDGAVKLRVEFYR